MKIVYQNVIWLLFFVTYNYLCLAEYEKLPEIKIGAFFNEENSQAKIVLKSAVYTTNLMQSVLKYEVIEKVISKTDSFKCGKILCQMTENGTAGIIGPPSYTTAPIIESICIDLEIPYIQVNWQPYSSLNPEAEEKTTVNFYPKLDLLSKGLAVVVKSLRWRSFVILYENDDGLIRLQDVLKLQDYDPKNKLNTIVIKQLGPGPDYRPLLKEVRNSTESRVILDCRTEVVLEILKQAVEVKLMEPYFNYFITSLDTHTLDLSILNTTANITTIRIIAPEEPEFTRALNNWQQFADINQDTMDLRPYSIKTETALMHDAVNMYIRTVNDLHVTQKIAPTPLSCGEGQSWTNGLGIASFLKVKPWPASISGPIHFDSSGQRDNFTIHVVEGSRENVIGLWNPTNPEDLVLTRSNEDLDNLLVQRMQTGTIVVSSRLGEPYLRERLPKYEGEIIPVDDRYEGYSKDLIAEIANELKFKFKFMITHGNYYGNYDHKTKQWNGLIRDILDHRADLAICDLTITHQRREAVDFSTPFMRLGISILYKKADEKQVNMFAFLAPFSIEVWIYTATLYLAVSVILYFVARMAPGDWENPHPCDQTPAELENIWDIKNCLWLTLGSIMTQGCDILPKGISSRMASSMWWFFSLIMTSSYTANLAAFLTMERMEPSIDSAEALAKQTKIKYGTVTGGATQSFFRDSNYSTYQKMWTTMQQSKPSVFEDSNAEGVKRVQTTRQRMYAFLMESSQIEYVIERKCDLKQVGNWLDSKGYGIAMPIDYPFRSAINKAILKLQEKGTLSKLKDKWWKKVRNEDEPPCDPGGEKESSNELALSNVGGVFLVLGAGVGISFLIAIMEFLWNVKNVSVEEHMTYWEALKVELLFAFNIWVTKKRTKPQISESSASSRSGEDVKSLAHSVLQGAGSIFNLHLLNKGDNAAGTREKSVMNT